MSEKKLRLWKGGLWGGPDCRNSSRLFFFFFPLAELKSPPCVWLEQKEGSKRNRERKRSEREGEREREEERRRQQAHSEGEKCSADDEIGGAVERAN